MLRFIRSLAQRKPPQLLQQELDTYKLAILTTLRLHGPESEAAQSLREGGAQERTTAHATALRANLDTQVAALLELSAPPEVRLEQGGENEEGGDDEAEQQWREGAAQRLSDAFGFTLEVRSSSVEGGGLGVFAKGNIAPGTVVALWPGLVYPPSELQRLPGFPDPQRFNDHLVARYDGAVIDAQPLSIPSADTGAVAERIGRLGWNPLSVAHRVNHPPPGHAPNLLQAGYTFPAQLESRAPNLPFDWQTRQHAAQPPPQGRARRGRAETAGLRGLVMVTIAPLQCGEELFVAYRFNPSHPTPSWYSDPCPEESRRRWTPLPLGGSSSEGAGSALDAARR